MAITRVKNVKDKGTGIAANMNFTSTTSGNTLIIAMVSIDDPTTPSNFTKITDPSNPYLTIFYRFNAPNSGLITIPTGNSGNPYIAFGMEYSGLDYSISDIGLDSQGASTGTNPDISTTTVTHWNYDLIISILGIGVTGGIFSNPTNLFNLIDQDYQDSISAVVCDRIATPAGTYSAKITSTLSGNHYFQTATFGGLVTGISSDNTRRKFIQSRRGKRSKF